MKYQWEIKITGMSDDKKSVMDLWWNLQGEVWHEVSNISTPEFVEIGE